jgi:hypothetical protein
MGKRIFCAAAFLVLVGVDCRAEMVCTQPARPELPSASADSREMEKAGKDVNAYIRQMKEYRECLLKIVNDADNELATVVDGWNYAVERFKGSRSGGQNSGK